MAKKKKSSPKKKKKPLPGPPVPVHPWRVCPYGEHWVETHPEHIQPSGRHPSGSVTTRHGHCAANPSGKNQLYPEESREISRQHFSVLAIKPCPIPLEFPNGAEYDDLIAGWVQYWNKVLKPTETLEPNIVKALIATESSFKPKRLADKKNQNSARGLMQVTNDTRKILENNRGEVKDHYISATREELNDPTVNICAGVRWLFHKRDLLSSKLKRQATWLETIKKYKGTSKVSKKREGKIIDKFQKRYEALQKCGKK